MNDKPCVNIPCVGYDEEWELNCNLKFHPDKCDSRITEKSETSLEILKKLYDKYDLTFLELLTKKVLQSEYPHTGMIAYFILKYNIIEIKDILQQIEKEMQG